MDAPAPSPTPPDESLTAKQTLRGWLLELLAEPEYAHAFPVEINVLPGNRVEVFVDSDTGVDFALCRRVSRHLEAHLDETLLLGERYTLEVSSPGVSRPLQLPRQFGKHVGRTLRVKLDDERAVEGELVAADDEAITLREERVVRDERGKRRKEEHAHVLPYGTFRGATVVVDFSKPKKPAKKKR